MDLANHVQCVEIYGRVSAIWKKASLLMPEASDRNSEITPFYRQVDCRTVAGISVNFPLLNLKIGLHMNHGDHRLIFTCDGGVAKAWLKLPVVIYALSTACGHDAKLCWYDGTELFEDHQ